MLPNYDQSILSTVSSILRHYGATSDYALLPALDAQLKTNPKHVF